MRRGWQNESYRHSLAARGISTSRRSFLFKRDETKHITEAFKSTSERYDHGHEISRNVAQKVKSKLHHEMDRLESKGLITIEDNRRFMEDQYGTLEKQFMDRTVNANQFKDDVDRSYRLFYQHHKKSNKAFGWADGTEEPEPTLFTPEERKGSGIFGF
jgi:hypothetical protein